MARIRTIYANDALFVGPTPSTGYHFTVPATANLTNTALRRAQIFGSGTDLVTQLHRVQSVNYDFAFDRTPVYQFGGLAAKDRIILSPPRVTLGFTYLLANFWNESGLGFCTFPHVSAISGILNKTQDDKNYFIKTSAEGVDAQLDGTSDSTVSVMGVGNGFITSYSTEAAVGGLPTVTLGVEGLNMMFQQGTSGTIPAVNPNDGSRMDGICYRIPTGVKDAGTGNLSVSVLRPGDITFTIKKRDAEDEGSEGPATSDYDTVGVDLDTALIQRYAINFNLGREVISKLGNRYGVSREITFPVPVTVSVDALAGDLLSGSVFDVVNCDDSYDITVDLYRPTGCSSVGRYIMCKYIIKNAKMNSQAFSESIGGNKTVSFQFESTVGGPSQTGIGIFLSGISTEAGAEL